VKSLNTIATSNKDVFERSDGVVEYTQDMTLRPAEQEILRIYRADYVGKKVLDLGVGAGRTTLLLALHAASYTGVDFSESMIAVCRGRFPQWNFQWGDARDLNTFAAASFDFVLFSFNGIDCVNDEDRQRILAEVLRVLKSGGVFAFSSHNLDAFEGATWRWRVVLRPRTPTEFVCAFRNVWKIIRGRLRNVGKQVRASHYAILNDTAHQYGLLLYYIGAEAQVEQLRQAGFADDVEIFGDDGLPCMSSVNDVFLHYVVRKPA